MISAWELPTSLSVGGVGFAIRTDYRVILDILVMFQDPEIEPDEKVWEMLKILYVDFDSIPDERYGEAAERASEFIDMGIEDDGKLSPRLMDWEQDASIIAPAVNGVMGRDVRAAEYIHWWTFLSAYMEIRESLFTEVVSIRRKLAKGKKLEKAEREFYRDNRALVNLKKKYTAEDEKILDSWLK